MQKDAIGTQAYWNHRVKNAKNPKDMLFVDPRREEYWNRVRAQLLSWKGLKVLDVCCGYGQFSEIVDDWTGVDFSTEMMALVTTEKPFVLADVKEFQPQEVYDVIFEVNSLHSLGWTPAQFYEHYKPYATKVVACLEADAFTIYQLYE